MVCSDHQGVGCVHHQQLHACMEIFAEVNNLIKSFRIKSKYYAKNITLCVKHSTIAEIVTSPSIPIARDNACLHDL